MLKQVSATGDVDVTNAKQGAKLFSVVLTPAAAVSTLVVKDGGSGGTTILSLQAAANGNSAVWRSGSGVPLNGVLHATLSGASAVAAFEY